MRMRERATHIFTAVVGATLRAVDKWMIGNLGGSVGESASSPKGQLAFQSLTMYWHRTLTYRN